MLLTLLEIPGKFSTVPYFSSQIPLVIETPGFDDSEEIYIDIFKMISEWLKQLYVLSYFVSIFSVSSLRYSLFQVQRSSSVFDHGVLSQRSKSFHRWWIPDKGLAAGLDDVEERRGPEREEYRPTERQPTPSNLPFSRPPENPTVENNDFIPSATLEPSSTVVQLHRSPATSTREGHDSAPSAAAELSITT